MPKIPCPCPTEAALNAALDVAERRGVDLHALARRRWQLGRHLAKYDEVVARAGSLSSEAGELKRSIERDVDVLAAALAHVTALAP
jgi:hypothetical protein